MVWMPHSCWHVVDLLQKLLWDLLLTKVTKQTGYNKYSDFIDKGMPSDSEVVGLLFWNDLWNQNSYLQIETLDEHFEICSLVGTITNDGSNLSSHLHTTLSRNDGSTVGGHVVSDMIVFTWVLIQFTHMKEIPSVLTCQSRWLQYIFTYFILQNSRNRTRQLWVCYS